MNDKIYTLEDNISAFKSMIGDLTKNHNNKYVLIYNGDFIDSFDNFNNAAQEAIRRFGKGPYLIRQVGAPNEIPLPASVAYQVCRDNC